MIMLNFVFVLIILVCAQHSQAKRCLPACAPPPTVRGCEVYLTAGPCWLPAIDTNPSVKKCGCLWKEYITSLKVPDRKTILTPDGVKCLIWALTVCGENNEDNGVTKVQPKEETLDVYGKPDEEIMDVYGATEKETGNVYGKTKTEKRVYKSAVRIGEDLKIASALKDPKQSFPKKGKKRLLDIDVHEDKFKLAVFGFILLFNIVCVSITVCCTCDAKRREKEARLSGDLDPSKYRTNKKEKASARTISIETFLNKLREYRKSKKGKHDDRSGILEMERVASGNLKQQMYSTMPGIQPIYDSVDEQSDLLDTTYEESMPTTGEMYTKHVRQDDLSDENTLYENLRPSEHSRTVSFNLATGGTSGEQDHVPMRRNKKHFQVLPLMKMTN